MTLGRRRHLLGTVAVVVAVTAAASLAVTSHGPAARARPVARPDAGDLLWHADPARGTGNFEVIDSHPGTVTVVRDATKGSSFRFDTSGVKEPGERVRIESKGHRNPDGSTVRFSTVGDTYYVGWNARWGPLPTAAGNWVVLWQLKDYGSGAATPPLSLRARGDGTIDLEYCDPDLKTTKLWTTPLRLNAWHRFVVGFTLSKNPSQGAVRLWYDGAAQNLAGGATRYPAATLRADFVTDKWGVYRSDGVSGPATAYLNDARVGTSYAVVR